MNSTFLFITTGRLTFDIELANDYFDNNLKLVKNNIANLIHPTKIITSVDELQAYIDTVDEKIDGVIFQSITFTDGEFMKCVIDNFSVPVLLWNMKDPTVGGRLRLNALTGAMSNANVLVTNNVPFLNFMGDYKTEGIEKIFNKKIKMIDLIVNLTKLKIGVFGAYPPGFVYSDANPLTIKKVFGIDLKRYELYKILNESRKVQADDYRAELTYAMDRVKGIDENDDVFIKFAQVLVSIKQYINSDDLGAITMRDWPDFFEELGVAGDGVISQLTDQGVMASCESDIHGVLSMYFLNKLTGNIPYLGDVVNLSVEDNTIITWHTYGAYSVAEEVRAGLHPNRKVGFSPKLTIKAGEVTLFRLNDNNGEYKFIISSGEAIKSEQLYDGTSGKIKLDSNVSDFMNRAIQLGVEPHLALVHGNVVDELIEIANYYNIAYEVI